MASNDELFNLLHSLSKSEKRYVKMSFGQHFSGEDSNYVLLYEYFQKQEAFDKDKVLKRFKGEKFINNYSATKAYLVENIMKALRSFHARKNCKTTLLQWLFDLQLLSERGLYDQMDKLLDKAKRLCYASGELNLLLEILDLERRHTWTWPRTTACFARRGTKYFMG